jgi:hypothetical protein
MYSIADRTGIYYQDLSEKYNSIFIYESQSVNLGSIWQLCEEIHKASGDGRRDRRAT